MEAVVSNVDVLYEIFQYLNLEELLKLTKVCAQFRTVIVDFMLQNKYKHVEVCKITQHFGMLLTNNVVDCADEDSEVGFECLKEDKTALNRSEVDNFLQMTACNIRMLALNLPSVYYKPVDNEKERVLKANRLLFSPADFGVTFERRHSFVNLTTVKFRHVVITEGDLSLLNENSRNLERVCLDDCFNVNEGVLVMGDDIPIATVQNMKSLKYFQVTVLDSVDKDLSYDVNKILRMLNVMQIVVKIRNFAIGDENDTDIGMTTEGYPHVASRCEDLTLGYFRSQRIFRKFNNAVLTHFKSLRKLVLESWALITINEEFCRKLAKTCGHLEYLKLQNFELNGFAAISTLKTLILENCTGLIWRDVKVILNEMKLKTFSILDTEYVGIFEYFRVASTLKHLLVINCQRNHLKKLFDIHNGQNLAKLTSIVWHDNFAPVPIYVATSCPQLKTLITEPSSLLIHNLYSLTHLEKLTLRVKRKIKFSKIVTILKHSNLNHFTLTKLKDSACYDEHNEYLIDYDMYDQELLEFDERKIHLTFINIPLNTYFKIAQDFWFNLLKNNPRLTLMIRYNRCLHSDHFFLKFIINHRKFPKRLHTIKVCGYIMDVKEFRNNFQAATEKLKSFSNIYKHQEDKGYILL